MAGIRERNEMRRSSVGRSGRRVRIGAALVALLALAPLVLAYLPDRAPEDPRRVAIQIEGLT